MTELKVYCECGEEIGSIVILKSGKIIGTGAVEAVSRKPGALEAIRLTGSCENCFVDSDSYEDADKSLSEAQMEIEDLKTEYKDAKSDLQDAQAKVVKYKTQRDVLLKKLEDCREFTTSANYITIGE